MVEMSRRRTLVAAAALALVAAACGGVGDESDDTLAPVTPIPTLGGVGAVPAVPSAVREPVVVVPLPVDVAGETAQLIGETVEGNRVLMIGDSILASTSSRYGNQMCEAVEPLGWQVAVEAEPSRFVEFGNRVLQRLLPDDVAPDDDWDAAVVFLGSNYRGDAFAYEAELVEMLDRLEPRPVLLLTVTEYRPNYVEVNVVINRLGAERDNVTVLDWESISETPGVLSSDGLHPTDAGRRVLADAVAAALGPVPDGEGDCLRSTFRNDSGVGSGNSSTVLGRRSSGSSSSSSSSSGSSSSSSGSSSSGSSGSTSGSSGSSGSDSVTTTVNPTTTSLPDGGGATTTTPAGGGVTTTAPVTTPTTPPVTAPPDPPSGGGDGSAGGAGDGGAGEDGATGP